MSDLALGLDEPSPASSHPYRVLARKYRPQTFRALIGQQAMVQTLENAIKRDRIAHAFLMTGVRGVGKTSTARLIAKALNCIGPDGNGGPTIDPCGVCEHCRAIAEGRDIDVIEIDAASHNGIDDVREITDASRYAAVSARYKIYIVDEVHMMSKPAFNALLKTLEEPPAHVKFLFATTEVGKVPVTVLSRCQRFDLRRIPAEALAAHFAEVAAKEGAKAEPEALMLIAQAAEGSARDGLSILDQAIAHAGMEGGGVTAAAVREMLGLSDRGAVRALFGQLLAGEANAVLAGLRAQYDLGIDPQSVMRALLETVHGITRTKVGTPPDAAHSAEERTAREEWSAGLSFPMLHRLWQLLLRGHDEVARAALPIEAAEMALLRIVHAASLPDPGELARQVLSGDRPLPVPEPEPPAAIPREPAPVAEAPVTFEALVAMLEAAGHIGLAEKLKLVSPIACEARTLVLSGSRPLSADTLADLNGALKAMNGRPWQVLIEDRAGEPSLRDRERAADDAAKAAILDAPIVRAAFEHFPDAVLEDWPGRRRA